MHMFCMHAYPVRLNSGFIFILLLEEMGKQSVCPQGDDYNLRRECQDEHVQKKSFLKVKGFLSALL